MRFSRARTETILRAILHEVRTEKLTFLAGSIAYHAFISILPLLLLVLTLVERTQNLTLRTSILGIMETVLTQQASDVLQEGLADADSSVSILGVVFLIWGALRIFRGLDTAFSDIYETESENTFLDQISDGLLLLVTVALAIIAVSLLRGAVTGVTGGTPVAILRTVVTAVGLFVLLYPMYYVFPDADVSFVETVPGTAFASVGLTVAHFLFTTWLYIISLITLLGASINAVLSNRSADVDIDPVFGGVAMASDRREDVRIDRSRLLANLEEMVTTFDDGGDEITILADGKRITVPRPGDATVDQSRAVYSSKDSVGLRLTWWPDGDE